MDKLNRSTKKSQLAAMYYLTKVNPKNYKLSEWYDNIIILMEKDNMGWENIHKVDLGKPTTPHFDYKYYKYYKDYL